MNKIKDALPWLMNKIKDALPWLAMLPFCLPIPGLCGAMAIFTLLGCVEGLLVSTTVLVVQAIIIIVTNFLVLFGSRGGDATIIIPGYFPIGTGTFLLASWFGWLLLHLRIS